MKNRNMVRNLIVASTLAAVPLSASAGRFVDMGEFSLSPTSGIKASLAQKSISGLAARNVIARTDDPRGGFSLSPTAPGSSLIKNTPGTTVQNATDSFDTVQVSDGILNVTGATTQVKTLDNGALGGTIGAPTPTTNMGWQIGQVAGNTATLTANGGAKLSGTNLLGGTNDGTINIVNLDGAGTEYNWVPPVAPETNGGRGWFVGFKGKTDFNITGGAKATARLTDLGRQKDTDGTLNISGPGSQLTTGTIQVGGGFVAPVNLTDASVRVNISNGGKLIVTPIGGTAGSMIMDVDQVDGEPENVGELRVSGTGSLLQALSATNTNSNIFGGNVFSVTAGGVVNAPGNVIVAPFFGKSGSMEVLGGSTATVGNLFMSTQAFADGSLKIANSTVTIGQLATAQGEEANTTVDITSSTVTFANVFTIAASLVGGKSVITAKDSTLNINQLVTGSGTPAATGENDTLTLDNSVLTAATFAVAADSGGVNTVWNLINGSRMTSGNTAFFANVPGTTAVLNLNNSQATYPLIVAGGSGPDTGGTATLNVTNGGTLTGTNGTVLFKNATVNVTGSTYNAGGLSDGNATDGVGTVNLTNGTMNLTLTAAQALDGIIIGTITGATGNFYTGKLSGTGTINKTGTAWEIFNGNNTGFTGTLNLTAGAFYPDTAFGPLTVVNNASPGVTQAVTDSATPETNDTLVLAGFDYSVGGSASLARISQTGPLSGVTTVGGTTALTLGGLRQADVTIFEGSSITIAPGSNATVQLADLTVVNDPITPAPAAFLNLTDNDLLIEYSGASPIGALISIVQGGVGILVNGDFGGLPTYLAIAEATDLGLTDFNGIAVDDTTVVAKYTFVGDANLDGQVDALDYERVDLAIGNSGVFGVAQGDLNYDGNVDALDYEQIDLNIGNGVGSPLAAVLIPEPASLSLVALGAGLLGRRRRA